jgi:hypothetical protein
MKYRLSTATAGCLVVLAACGGNGGSADVTTLTDACTSTTNLPPRVCECVANKAKDELSDDAFAFLVASMNEDEDAAAELRSKLEISEAMTAGMFMVNAPAACAQELGPN